LHVIPLIKLLKFPKCGKYIPPDFGYNRKPECVFEAE